MKLVIQLTFRVDNQHIHSVTIDTKPRSTVTSKMNTMTEKCFARRGHLAAVYRNKVFMPIQRCTKSESLRIRTIKECCCVLEYAHEWYTLLTAINQNDYLVATWVSIMPTLDGKCNKEKNAKLGYPSQKSMPSGHYQPSGQFQMSKFDWREGRSLTWVSWTSVEERGRTSVDVYLTETAAKANFDTLEKWPATTRGR